MGSTSTTITEDVVLDKNELWIIDIDVTYPNTEPLVFSETFYLEFLGYAEDYEVAAPITSL